MKALPILALSVALSAFAQEKKADPPKEPAKTEAEAPPQTPKMRQLSASQMYALQKANEGLQSAQEKQRADTQRDAEDVKTAQQIMQAVGMSIQQDCGCRITQQNGKLVGIVEPKTAAKK